MSQTTSPKPLGPPPPPAAVVAPPHAPAQPTAGKRDIRSTRDLSLAAWMQFKGMEMVECRVNGHHEYHFAFLDQEGRWSVLATEWANSDCRRFDDALRTLKKVAQQAAPRRGGWR